MLLPLKENKLLATKSSFSCRWTCLKKWNPTSLAEEPTYCSRNQLPLHSIEANTTGSNFPFRVGTHL
jgi:hypothetical protein